MLRDRTEFKMIPARSEGSVFRRRFNFMRTEMTAEFTGKSEGKTGKGM